MWNHVVGLKLNSEFKEKCTKMRNSHVLYQKQIFSSKNCNQFLSYKKKSYFRELKKKKRELLIIFVKQEKSVQKWGILMFCIKNKFLVLKIVPNFFRTKRSLILGNSKTNKQTEQKKNGNYYFFKTRVPIFSVIAHCDK